ncbi:EpsG family protein [Capnocytophaga sp. G2]|uniref:EpsG family protein n=1 Tax=Capnocytophaga sp. G2 TaxID=3110695 RepID=UPI002B48A897|nr:EpsG family protein [Capnocytophaga sp. G2]MEB3004917.1 EpsG family protein [Capnocytophaga sp. G2]
MYFLVPIYSFLAFAARFFFTEKLSKEVKTYIYVFSYIPIIFALLYIAGLRNIEIGIDTFHYGEIFEDPNDIEIGFQWFAEFIKYIGGNFHFFLFLFFFISLFLKLYAFKKVSLYPLLSICIYSSFWFLVYEMNGIRQGIALGFIALCYYYLTINKKKKFYLSLVGAILFHYSALIFLPLIFVIKKKCTKILFWAIFSIVFLFAYLGVTTFLLGGLGAIMGVDLRLIERILSYQQNEAFNANILYSFSTFVRLLLFFTTYFFINKVKLPDQTKNIFLWCALLNISTYLLFSEVEIIATRLSLYYRFYECFFLACLPNAFKGKGIKILIGFLLCLYALSQIIKTLSIPNNGLIPYKSILF